jgi:hypothetical protein
MGSIRDKFIALAKAGGNRKDFFNLAKSEGLTDKEKLAPKQKGNKWTKAFSAASGLNLEGKEKTSVFKNLSRMKGVGSKLVKGTGEQDIQGDPISGEGLLIEPKMVDRDDKSHGGLIKGKPRLAKKGWR